MVDLRIGTGGWAYFRVPGTPSLKAYSSAFDFVEVNSTYYEYPRLETVARWRKTTRASFEFAVSCHKQIMSGIRAERENAIVSVAERMGKICRSLDAQVLAVLVQTPGIREDVLVKGLEMFLSAFKHEKTKAALEFRGNRPSPDVLKLLEDNGAIQTVDLSRDDPSVHSNILYSRLFGKGRDNIYEFDDEELEAISTKASQPRFEKSILAFHGVRMYRDAARLKTFLKTGEFPNITGKTGLQSLDYVLREDAKFPTTRDVLVDKQGWKLFDLTENQRARAGEFLERLSEKNFSNLGSVIRSLERMF